MIVATFTLTLGVFIWSQGEHLNHPDKPDTYIDQYQHLHVLNIELGATTLRQAETRLQSRSDIALYIYPNDSVEKNLPKSMMRLEAFFPAIADHSKVILHLEAPPEMLHAMQQHGTLPHLYPNNVLRINLNSEDTVLAQQLIVHALTLIPSIEITSELLRQRFGPPSNIERPQENIRIEHFPNAGLTATITTDDATQLRFENPGASDRNRDGISG
ncbi:MAG: hypothetical protein HQM07_07050 [Zetaproteobacteria bacterium]|nr:hypothetical protein [Zetaproteobacteria bacterium]